MEHGKRERERERGGKPVLRGRKGPHCKYEQEKERGREKSTRQKGIWCAGRRENNIGRRKGKRQCKKKSQFGIRFAFIPSEWSHSSSNFRTSFTTTLSCSHVKTKKKKSFPLPSPFRPDPDFFFLCQRGPSLNTCFSQGVAATAPFLNHTAPKHYSGSLVKKSRLVFRLLL